MRRVGVLESPNNRPERGRKEGFQEGLAMPVQHKKRKDAIQEGGYDEPTDSASSELEQPDKERYMTEL